MELLIILAILIAVVMFVSGPLRRPESSGPGELSGLRPRASRVAELHAAREAKYREIRDAELDHRMGKLADADYEELDRTLRAEAIEILRALDATSGAPAEANGNPAATIPER